MFYLTSVQRELFSSGCSSWHVTHQIVLRLEHYWEHQSGKINIWFVEKIRTLLTEKCWISDQIITNSSRSLLNDPNEALKEGKSVSEENNIRRIIQYKI